eukprot:PhF_6_TR7995/c1_g2_i1/m.12296
MGISRSATIVIAYLMTHKGMSIADALHYTQQKRSVVSPNYGFMQCLVEYEKQLGQQRVSRFDVYLYASTRYHFDSVHHDTLQRVFRVCRDKYDQEIAEKKATGEYIEEEDDEKEVYLPSTVLMEMRKYMRENKLFS